MDDNLPVISSGELALVRESLNRGRISNAMNHFRRISLSAPLPLLFGVYCELKNEMTSVDEESRKNFGVFNDLFLRMLEERGETATDIYRSLLRDSSEFTYLQSLFGSKVPHAGPRKPKKIKEAVIIEPAPVAVTLKKVLAAKDASLIGFDMNAWRDLVKDHLDAVRDESAFIRVCTRVIKQVSAAAEREDFHLELVIVYIFERLMGFSELSGRSKDFAMNTLNLVSGREQLWKVLHGQFREIIRR